MMLKKLIKPFKLWGCIFSLSLHISACYRHTPPRLPPEKMQELSQYHTPQLAWEEGDLKTIEQLTTELKELQKIEPSFDTISPGDEFNISVYEEPEMTEKGVVVRPDGYLSYKLIGDVKVIGLTVPQAKILMTEKLKAYIKNPRINLSPYHFSGRSFTIIGKVNRPGSYSLTRKMRVLDAIGLSQGLSVGIIKNDSTELADLKNAFMVRNNKVLPVNFESLIKKGNMLHNLPLVPDDYIYIPSVAQREVYVLGEVYEQNSFNYSTGMTLSQVIAYSKGIKDSANLSAVQLVRGKLTEPQLYIVDINAILAGTQKDITLEAMDIIYIPGGPAKEFKQLMEVILPSIQTLQGSLLLYEVIRLNGQP